ncbi:MAG: lipoyl synthase [Anaerolineaceae bacterium]
MKNKTTRDRVNSEKMDTTPVRRPDWIKVRAPNGETYAWLKELMQRKELHTVCEEANCPNMGECWGSGTATFLVLGDICTRRCGFCDVKRGVPLPLDEEEPGRVAQAVKAMELKHAVITSVDRDDDILGGARIFARIIRRIHEEAPGCSVEVLIPDFRADPEALRLIMAEHPEILNHNVETVQRLYHTVQPQDHHEWSQYVLTTAKQLCPDGLTKSGIMVGLGETWEELEETMRELREWNVDILTIGQYLQPSRQHLPIARYYTMEEFQRLKDYGYSIGFRWVESAPLVRSSYHAAEQVRELSSHRIDK